MSHGWIPVTCTMLFVLLGTFCGRAQDFDSNAFSRDRALKVFGRVRYAREFPAILFAVVRTNAPRIPLTRRTQYNRGVWAHNRRAGVRPVISIAFSRRECASRHALMHGIDVPPRRLALITCFPTLFRLRIYLTPKIRNSLLYIKALFIRKNS